MSFPPGYFELLAKLDEARGKEVDTYNDQDWQELASPPYPQGINRFPPEPEAQIVAIKTIPDRIILYAPPVTMIYRNQTLTVIGYYNNFLNATVTPETPYSRLNTITTGATQTQSFSTSLGLSLGVKIEGIVDLSTNLSATFGTTITLYKEETVQDIFQVISTKGELSVCWWQAIYEYQLKYEVILQDMLGVHSYGYSTDRFFDNVPTFISTQYPRTSEGDSPLYTAKFANLKV